MGGMLIVGIFIITLSFFAMICDLRTYKIPNLVNAVGAATGIFFNIILFGVEGIKNSFLGIVCPIIMLYIFFAVGVIGAGDIKLLAGIGSFISKKIIYIILLAFIIAGLYSLTVVLIKIFKRLISKDNRYVLSKMHLSVPIFLSCFLFALYGLFVR